jgi:hypothetical protein
VVRLEIDGPDDAETPDFNEQWMLRDGPFAVLVSSASDDGRAVGRARRRLDAP